MKESRKESQKYFQEALSDFTYDAASGRAIRHLVDVGLIPAQILQRLDYPTPLAKVRHTVTRHLLESGILLEELPISPASLHASTIRCASESQLFSSLSRHICENKEAHSFISCPFGMPSDSKNPQAESIRRMLSFLTAREREYIDGIEWPPKMMYHRLNRRMLEIGVQLAMHADTVSFYFLKSREAVHVHA